MTNSGKLFSDELTNRRIDESGNNFPELVIPYIYLFSLNGIPKYLAYSRNYYPYLLSKFIKTLCLTLDCINVPMKSNCCTTDVFLASSDSKYFRGLIGSFGSQVSPIISLFRFIILQVSSDYNHQI